ncbi:hypothetical protein Glove_218g37 [Diversispora epigaea]|uniref:Uncharacterized protein n=1 Tax=Diversispora epigaea TaxID=1348612 RepID=A0A397IGE4_9GLOM|nr:hypothetical protein Glove_218g37 [Diversispora epigaea]
MKVFGTNNLRKYYVYVGGCRNSSTFFKSQGKEDSNFRKFIKKTNENKFLKTSKKTTIKACRWRFSSSWLGSPRLGSPQLSFSQLGSPQLSFSRLGFSWLGSSQLFESLNTPDTIREEGDTTGSDTEGAEIVEQYSKAEQGSEG